MTETTEKKIKNSIANYQLFGGCLQGTQQLSKDDTVMQNVRNYFVSFNRNEISAMYITFGLIQVLIDVPVDDAFRGGFKIKSDELDEDEIAQVMQYFKEHRLLQEIKQLAKWTRLFGGGGMVIDDDSDDPTKPLNIEKINKKSVLKFYPADLWELNYQNANSYQEPKPYLENIDAEKPYFYYGVNLHKSRVIKTKGKEAPAFLRPKLRGWGMSEVERFIRELNTKLKNDNLIFELLDEAKLDVVKIEGFNSALIDAAGTQEIVARAQMAMQIKNFQNSLFLDKDDEFDQKQISFSGLSEMSGENRINIASAMRMPLTKIFGLSASGFNSGEDDIENYNAMIESEIRGEFDHVIINIVKLVCQKLLGYIPEDLEIEYRPLRVLKSTEEQEIKDKEFNRLTRLFEMGVIDIEQYEEQLNLANITQNKLKLVSENIFEKKRQEKAEEEAPKVSNSKKKRIFKWRGN